MTLKITSLQNPRIKAVIRLRERREREATGTMLVEGHDELALACAVGLRPRELYFAPDAARPEERELATRLAGDGVPLVEVTAAVMTKLAYREHPGALLAVAATPSTRLDDLILPANPLLIIAEGVEKPGNLGAILRSADAAGAAGVILCAPRTDFFNPNVVRASKGTVFRVPIASTDHDTLFAWLAAHNIALIAADPAATTSFWDADLSGPLALAVGTEHDGLSPRLLATTARQVTIPMVGAVNSLNVAQALTLLVYEAARQRRG